jgi:hypothetical protein
LRVRMTVEVSDAIRRYIATQYPTHKPNHRKLARRTTIETYINDRLKLVSSIFPYWDSEPVLDEEDTRAAISMLRGEGWDDMKIRAWLYTQAARCQIARSAKP